MFYDIYQKLCQSHNITPSKAAVEMGINKASVTYWKKTGASPSPDVLQKVAQYFQVSTDELLELPTQSRALVTKKDLKFALFGKTDIDDELLQEVKDFAQFAQNQRKKKK